MSDCPKFEADLSALIDNELPAARQAEVLAHVEQCPQCEARMAELRRQATGIAALPAVSPAPQFLADVRRKLRQPETSWADVLFRPVWWKVPLEAMAVIVVVAGVFMLARPAPNAPVVVAQKSPGLHARI